MASCFVSYVDVEGIRHAVEVEAGSLYEAAVLAATTLKQHQCAPADASNLEIEIRSSVTHTITLKKVRQWLGGGARSPKEAVTKERLRELLLRPASTSKTKATGSLENPVALVFTIVRS